MRCYCIKVRKLHILRKIISRTNYRIISHKLRNTLYKANILLIVNILYFIKWNELSNYVQFPKSFLISTNSFTSFNLYKHVTLRASFKFKHRFIIYFEVSCQKLASNVYELLKVFPLTQLKFLLQTKSFITTNIRRFVSEPKTFNNKSSIILSCYKRLPIFIISGTMFALLYYIVRVLKSFP